MDDLHISMANSARESTSTTMLTDTLKLATNTSRV